MGAFKQYEIQLPQWNDWSFLTSFQSYHDDRSWKMKRSLQLWWNNLWKGPLVPLLQNYIIYQNIIFKMRMFKR